MPALNDSAAILIAPGALVAGALLQIVLAPLLSSRVKGMVAAACALPSLIAVLVLLPGVQAGQSFDFSLLSWDGPLALAVHVDALSILFAFMGTCLGAIVLLYSVGYMAHDASATRFYVTMLLFIAGFVALVFMANMFLMYVCWEIVGLCSFSLVGFWYKQRDAVEGARKVLLMTHIAGYGLLAAVLLVYYRTGTALWTDPNFAGGLSTGVFVLMLVALLAKSVQVPLHTWIPDAMAAPTPVSSLLHAACYVTAGVYLAARMHSFCPWPALWSATLVWFGTVTMVVGVMYALVQTDLKRMLAFSTVSQIGYMMLGLGIGTPLGITAGLLHCLNHGFFKGGLFLNAGAVQHAAGTRDMNSLGGLAQRMPWTTACWLIGVGNMAGIPLMSGFVSKWMLYAAGLQAGWAIPAVIAWMASLGTVFLCVKSTSIVFLGPPTECTREAHEAPASMRWAMALMAAGSIVLGIAPQLAVQGILNPVLAAFGLGSAMHVTWLGLFTGAGSFSTVAGLVLCLISLLLGGVIYALAHSTRSAPVQASASGAGGALMLGGMGDVFTGGEPMWTQNRLNASDFSKIFEQDWQSFFRWSNVDRFYLNLWELLRLDARVLARATTWLEKHALLLVLVLAAGAIPLVRIAFPEFPVMEPHPTMLVPTVLMAACAVAAIALLAAAFALPGMRSSTALMTLSGALVVAACLMHAEWLRFGLLEAGAVLTIPLVWPKVRTHFARYLYFSTVLLSGTCFGLANWFLQHEQGAWSRAFLFTSVGIKLAVIPFSFWLLRIADEIPALLLGFIIAVVDIAAVGELWVLAQVDPALFAPPSLWLASAILTSLAASLLMLVQRSLKRLLVLSTIEDAGFLILGLASFSTLGLKGTLAAAVTHALAKALLFVSIAAPEEDGALEPEHSGLASRYGFSGFGFLLGMLAMLGVPPLVGFVGRWKLYETALRIDPLLLAGFVLSSAFALIAYIRALSNSWWGDPHNPEGQPPGPLVVKHRVLVAPVSEPWTLRIVIVVLVALLLAGGLWPDAVAQVVTGGRP